MPFRSKRQQRFMYATKPKGVDLDEWAKETDFDKIPEKVRKKRKKKDKSDLRGGPTPIPRSKIIEFLLSKDKHDTNDVFQGPESLEAHGDELDWYEDENEILNIRKKRGKCRKCGKEMELTSKDTIPYHESNMGNPTCPGSQCSPKSEKHNDRALQAAEAYQREVKKALEED
jgi:endogenous inhibitor of DNA gyrase (YacG/DUF329 family)